MINTFAVILTTITTTGMIICILGRVQQQPEGPPSVELAGGGLLWAPLCWASGCKASRESPS